MRPSSPGALSESTILQRITKLPHGKVSFKQLVKEFGVKGAQRDRIEAILAKLAKKGVLIELRGGQFVLASKTREFAVGRVSVHRDGFGFLIPDHPIEGLRGDVFLPADEASKTMHGDRAVVRVGRIGSDGRADGEVYRILERAHQTVVGEFRVQKFGCLVRPHDERLREWIEIPEGMEIPPQQKSVDRVGVEPRVIRSVEDLDGMIVNVEILDYSEDGDRTIGRVIEVLGYPDDFGIDVEIVIRKHHIPHEFPPEAIAQARAIPAGIPEEEIARRQDFRGMDVVTIDGETARDFDDAVWVDRLRNGNYALHVHIADVSYYVRPGSSIDEEALRRGTSVYFPDRAVPMLPVELSTDICSLRPQVDRLVLSALLEIDPKGEVIRQEFTRGIIRSAERMTYTNVYKLLEGDAEQRERYAALIPRFELMQELALILMRKRDKRGSIDFDLPEPIIEFDTQGEMIAIVRSPRNIAHRLIEEFMLAANEAVAGHLEAADIPSIYRIHEPPDPKRILDFDEIASTFGYSLLAGAMPVKKFRHTERKRDGRKVQRDLVLPDESVTVASKAYQKLVRKLEGKPEERILTYLMLRSLKQAKYSEKNQGHFALATPSYTHFTSPIRRYPDLMVHRLLAAILDHETPGWTEEQLHSIAEDSSMTERRADEAERELVEWKKAKFMADLVGEEFEGLITSTTRFGFFVELDKYYVEGLVPLESLPGERFLYHENGRKIIGERSRRTFSMGDRVKVVLDRVDATERKLTFSLLEERPARPRRRKA